MAQLHENLAAINMVTKLTPAILERVDEATLALAD
jgi:hypothetical protein